MEQDTLGSAPPAAAREDADVLAALIANLRAVYLGRAETAELLVTALLARGHILIEDTPGVGKTTLAQSLARSIKAPFQRVQFTPDLLPSDLLGMSIYRQDTGDLVWKPGPIFAHVVLADEINRTNPRTQAALLEAMAEGQVSIEGQTRALPDPFLVLATQNPFEFEGTYPLPESQLDRFLLRIELGYPSAEDEAAMLRAQARRHPIEELEPVLDPERVLALQRRTREVHVEDAVLEHIVAIAQRSRSHEAFAQGISPRGTLALRRAAQAWALVRGRDYVIPEDIATLLVPVCGHRVALRRDAGLAGGELRRRVRGVLEALRQELPAPL